MSNPYERSIGKRRCTNYWEHAPSQPGACGGEALCEGQAKLRVGLVIATKALRTNMSLQPSSRFHASDGTLAAAAAVNRRIDGAGRMACWPQMAHFTQRVHPAASTRFRSGSHRALATPSRNAAPNTVLDQTSSRTSPEQTRPKTVMPWNRRFCNGDPRAFQRRVATHFSERLGLEQRCLRGQPQQQDTCGRRPTWLSLTTSTWPTCCSNGDAPTDSRQKGEMSDMMFVFESRIHHLINEPSAERRTAH